MWSYERRETLGFAAFVCRGTGFAICWAKRDKDEKRYHLCLYAKNKTGYQNLMRLVSLAHREGFYFCPRIDRVLLERYHEGLACTSACIAGEVASCLDRGETTKAEEAARLYKNLFGEDYCLEVMLHPDIRRHPDIPKDAEIEHIDMFQRQQKVMNGLLALGKMLEIPCLASNDVHFVCPEDVDAHDVWLALGTGQKMIDPHRIVYTGSVWLKRGDEMAELFLLWNVFEIRSPDRVNATVGRLNATH